jgi:hypothetical protein
MMALVNATAAYEQEEEAAPKPQAMASDFGEELGRSRLMVAFGTRACTMADKPRPKTKAQKISQPIMNAIFRACSRAINIDTLREFDCYY